MVVLGQGKSQSLRLSGVMSGSAGNLALVSQAASGRQSPAPFLAPSWFCEFCQVVFDEVVPLVSWN